MTNDSHSDASVNRLNRLGWLPVPLFLTTMLVLWSADLHTAYESRFLLTAFNFVFSTLASVLVAVLVGRTYLVRGSPGLLLLGCGVLIWGAAGTLVPVLFPYGTNALIGGHNALVWFSAVLNIAGALFALRRRLTPSAGAGSGSAPNANGLSGAARLPTPEPRGRWFPGLTLALVYAAAAGLIWLVVLLAMEDWLPAFFVQGQGGTPLRAFVLGSAIVMFVLTAAVLWRANRPTPSAFGRWYGAALLLVATGLLGIMIESVHGGALSWTGRAAQFLGGAYMLIAAIASMRETRTWEVPLRAALDEVRQQYQTLFETMTAGFAVHEIITDDQGRPCDYRFLDVNPAFERLTGLKRADLVGKRVLEVMPGTESHWIEGYGRVVLTGEPLHMENYSVSLDRWYEVLAYRTAPGQFAVVFSDITGRKRVEAALRESEERLRLAQDVAGIGIWEWSPKSGKTTWSPEIERIHGVEPGALTGYQEWRKLVHPEDLARVEAETKEAIIHRRRFDMQFRIIRPSGELRWVATLGGAIYDGSGEVVRAFGVNMDITERTRAEEALRQANEELKVFNSAAVGRELRMVELKKEVNALCIAAGQPPRYDVSFEK